jgi:general secretion pathway protein I
MPAWLRGLQPADAGLSLVELAVAILILSIATIASFRVLDQGARQASSERDRVLAETVALNRAAELRLGETGLPDLVTLAGRTWVVATTGAAAEAGLVEMDIAVTAQGGGAGARIVTFVDGGRP